MLYTREKFEQYERINESRRPDNRHNEANAFENWQMVLQIAREMAEPMASRMAEPMASRMAHQMADQMAPRMAHQIAAEQFALMNVSIILTT